MPHHVRQQVHHNINQDETTDNIERAHPSVADPETRAELEVGGDAQYDHKGGREGPKPPRGLPQEYNDVG